MQHVPYVTTCVIVYVTSQDKALIALSEGGGTHTAGKPNPISESLRPHVILL
jgi:hypothetical protein